MSNAEKSSRLGVTVHLLGKLGIDEILIGNVFYLNRSCRKYFAGFKCVGVSPNLQWKFGGRVELICLFKS